MESILTSIKKLLGIEEEYEHFDTDIIIYINAAFMNLNQLGIGPSTGFMIEDKTSTWVDFIGNRTDLSAIKTYVFLKTRLIFDPPQMGYLVDAITNQIRELEWRLNIQVESGIEDVDLPPDFDGPLVLDYNELINKPKIESSLLVGNKKLNEIGVDTVSNESITTLFK